MTENDLANGTAGRWRVVGASVRGAMHRRSGLPNQDAMRWFSESGDGLPLVLAVADGHGSAKCFRSRAGAQHAVDVAIEVIGAFAGAERDRPDTATPPNEALMRRLVEELVCRWRRRVRDELEQTPFAADELDLLEEREGEHARTLIEATPYLAYGTTLVVVVMTGSYVMQLQIGDGDVLVVSEAGEVTRPLPPDVRLMGNQTTSLCSRAAARDFRVGAQRVHCGVAQTSEPAIAPALILVSTDGYANSFCDDIGFLQVGSDLLELIRLHGIDAIRESLESWLDEASKFGSGDDVTLGVVCNLDAVRPYTVAGSPSPPGPLSHKGRGGTATGRGGTAAGYGRRPFSPAWEKGLGDEGNPPRERGDGGEGEPGAGEAPPISHLQGITVAAG